MRASSRCPASSASILAGSSSSLPRLETGGFPFEFANDNYPDVDDTAVVVLALRRLGLGAAECDRGLAWTLGMQSSDGGWGAFDVDNTSDWLYRIPFFDFGAVVDPPSEDVAAHAVEALAPHPQYTETTSLNWQMSSFWRGPHTLRFSLTLRDSRAI